MRNKNKIKATIGNILVAFIFVCIIYCSINYIFGDTIQTYLNLAEMMSIKTTKVENINVAMDKEKSKLETKPNYGTKYAKLEIPSINVSLSIYDGDTLSVLRKGIGHSPGSYYPGEGGSIIMMGHNTRGYLYNLSKINIGDEIKITTTYGTFIYKIYNTRIVEQENVGAVYVRDTEEELLLYTCYPVNTLGHATKRFITYSKLVSRDYND